MAKKEAKEEIIETPHDEVVEPFVETTSEVVDQSEIDEGDEAAEPKAAKAGKRSAKAQREAEEAEHKPEAKEEKVKPKVKHVPNMKKRYGKNYLAAKEMIEKGKFYELTEALELVKRTAKVKFDPSVEIHVNLGVDPRQADQMVRSTVVLPAGTGKTLRVAVLTSPDKSADAKSAGADIVSEGDLIDKIDKGQMDFDVLIATPDMMAKLGKVAKVLGPRGLMPNPKSGTVTANIKSAVEQAKAGKVEFRIDKQAIVHLAIGKASFDVAKLEDNAKAVIDAILKSKPSATKGTYVRAMSLTTSMGPGIKLDVQKAIAAANPKR